MKYWVLILGFLFMTQLPCFAEETSTANNMSTPTLSTKTSADVADHTHTYVDTNTHAESTNRDKFEMGTYLDFEYEINKSLAFGIKNSYLFEPREFTSLAGVTVKFGCKEKSEESWR